MGAPPTSRPSVHFREMWTRALAGFVATARNDAVPEPGLQLGFAPELLPPEVGYARLVPRPDGRLEEEGDRWAQALVLTDIAADCFAEALLAASAGIPSTDPSSAEPPPPGAGPLVE